MNWGAIGSMVGIVGIAFGAGVTITKLESSNADVQNQIEDIVNDQSLKIDLPPGAVVAFDLDVCPKGWDEYKQAYGKFIRGIDRSSSKTDPSGERTPGDIQLSAIQEHKHTHWLYKPKNKQSEGMSYAYTSDGLKKFPRNELADNGSETGGVIDAKTKITSTETRPVNVALLYCEKR